MNRRAFAWIPLLALAASAARADVVYLKNGNKMEGAVTAETRTSIDLDIGYGSATLQKADILRVVRSGKKDGGRTGKTLERRRFESGDGVPKGVEKLDGLYRGVASLREKAMDGRRQWNSLQDEKAGIEEAQPDLRKSAEDAAAALAGADARDPNRYNQLVVESNRAANQVHLQELRLEDIAKEQDAADSGVHAYLEAYQEFKDALSGADGKAAAAGSSADKDYFVWASGEARAMAGDFREDSVPARSEGNQLFVNVLLNGKVSGRFLVDTGASTTLLYKKVADELRLGPQARVGRAKTKVADGRTVEADVMLLDSIAVGKSRVPHSLVAVVPASGQDFDGLLGMSFLGHFVSRVDVSNGRLILEDLKSP